MKLIKRISALFMVVMIMSTFTAIGFASETTTGGGESTSASTTDAYETYLENNIKGVTDTGIVVQQGGTWIKSYLTPDSSKSDSSQPYITIGSTPLYLISGRSETELERQISKAQNEAKTTQNVTALTDNLGIDPDLDRATAMLSGFIPFIEMVIGVMITLITLGMTVFSAFDIAYIAFPVFRNKCEDAKASGTSGMMTKQKSNGESSLRWVTDDAQYAVTQGTVENGKNPWGIYFKKRVISYIMLAIILFILMTGNISLITNIALKVVAGIMDVLASLA